MSADGSGSTSASGRSSPVLEPTPEPATTTAEPSPTIVGTSEVPSINIEHVVATSSSVTPNPEPATAPVVRIEPENPEPWMSAISARRPAYWINVPAFEEEQTLQEMSLRIPAEEAVLHKVEPYRTTVEPPVVRPSEEMAPHVEEALRMFTDQWVIVGRIPRPIPTSLPPLPRQVYESDTGETQLGDLGNCAVVPEHVSDETSDADIAKSITTRQHHRVGIFRAYNPSWAHPGTKRPTLCPPVHPALFTVTRPCELVLEVLSVETDLRNFEPLFVTACVYDVAGRCRVSSDFLCDVNSPAAAAFTVLSTPFPRCVRAVIPVDRVSPQHVLVVSVSRLLTCDPEEAQEVYASKAGKSRDKAAAKITEQIGALEPEAREFRQVLAWGFVPLFDAQGELALRQETRIEPLYRNKGGLTATRLTEIIGELMGKKKPSMGVVPDSRVVVSVTKLTDRGVANSIDAALQPLKEPPNPAVRSAPGTGLDPRTCRLQPFPYHVPLGNYADVVYRNMLYVAPISVNLAAAKRASSSIRNVVIKIELRSDDTEKATSLPVVQGYGHHTAGLGDHAYTHTLYHNQKPTFNDLFALRLPVVLTPRHHVLFTFYHVVVRKLKRGEQRLVPAGYAILRLTDALCGVTATAVTELKVTSVLAPGYLTKPPAYIKDEEVFTVQVQMESSINTDQAALVNIFAADTPQALPNELDALRKLPRNVFLQFYNIIAQRLLSIVRDFDTVALDAMSTLMAITRSLDPDAAAYDRHAAPVHFASAVCNDDCIHEFVTFQCLRLILQLQLQNNTSPRQTLVAPTGRAAKRTSRSNAPLPVLAATEVKPLDLKAFLSLAWFPLTLIQRSMVMRLAAEGRLAEPVRSHVFESFHPRLRSLIIALTVEVIDGKDLQVARALNETISLFLCDLLSFYNRDLVLELIQECVSILTDRTAPHNANHVFKYKCDFLRNVMRYEDLVLLSLPAVTLSQTVSAFNGLRSLFMGDDAKGAKLKMDVMTPFVCTRHFLPTMLIYQVIKFGFVTTDFAVRFQGLDLLIDVLTLNEADPRYQTPSGGQLVASIYFPLILMSMDEIETVKAWWNMTGVQVPEKRAFFAAFLFVLRNLSVFFILDWWAAESHPRMAVFMELLDMALTVFEFDPHLVLGASQVKFARASENKALLEAHYMGGSLASAFVSRARSSTVVPPNLVPITEQPQRATTARNSIAAEPGMTPSLSTGDLRASLRGSRDLAESGRSRSGTLTTANPTIERDREAVDNFQQGTLCTEANLVILDTLVHLLTYVDAKGWRGDWTDDQRDNMTSRALELLSSMACKRSSVKLISELHPVLRRFVTQHRSEIFRPQRHYCADLAAGVIAQCSFWNTNIRLRAIGFMYFMFKHNFLENGTEFRLWSSRITIALSALISGGSDHNPEHLSSALDSVSLYAKADSSMPPAFRTLMVALRDRLFQILHDTLEITKAKKAPVVDPELLADLYYGMTESYRPDPELRSTWFQGLCLHYEKTGDFLEAGLARLHSAGLVAGVLLVANPELRFDFGLLERTVPLYAKSITEAVHLGGLADSDKAFTHQYLIQTLRVATIHFQKCNAHELALSTFRLMLPLYEANSEYSKVEEVLKNMLECTRNIITANATRGSRLLGSYYRLGFYGVVFGAMNGREYVYKELPFTHLFSLTERIEALYRGCLPGATIEIIKDSAPVDVATLDAAKGYIQITSVVPSFSKEELARRETDDYKQQSQIDHFEFTTPYTLSGKAHGSTAEQWKRRTILTVREAFPSILKRSLIVSKTEINISPVQNAIEAIIERREKLEVEIKARNAKALQNILQGTVLVQVNKGSMDICEAFLGPAAPQWPVEEVRMLQGELNKFLQACHDSLTVNRSLLAQGQAEFQQKMEEGFKDLKSQMAPYLA